jgi:hypothetical protein
MIMLCINSAICKVLSTFNMMHIKCLFMSLSKVALKMNEDVIIFYAMSALSEVL